MLGAELITIHAGKGTNQKHFTIHRELLFSVTNYFKNLHTKDAEVRLENGDAEVFGLMVDWLYRGSLPDQVQEKTNISLPPFTLTAKMQDLIKLFALAERYEIATLADQSMETIIKRRDDSRGFAIDCSTVADTYKFTTSGSTIRLFMAKVFASRILSMGSGQSTNNRELGRAMAQHEDLAVDFINLIRGKNGVMIAGTNVEGCEYHQHGKYVACPYSKARRN